MSPLCDKELRGLTRTDWRKHDNRPVTADGLETGAYLYLCGAFMPAAGDVDHEGPLVGLHQHPGGLGAGGVVGGGTAAVWALHAAARRLLHALLAVVAFLNDMTDTGLKEKGQGGGERKKRFIGCGT